MILQALASYHQRSSDKKTSDKLAQLGWISKLIDFAIVIDRTGRFVTVDDLRETKDGKHAGKLTFVPNIGKQAQKHTNSGKDANLLWDDVRFILGRKAKGKTTMEAFCRTVEEFFPTGQTQVDAG
ncbi:MAG: type I-C CRISPR-associated protein Cas8c/Csd1, partial [Planctomycetota bacterium]|nr:type I-C CRISPR-associated protein Cas8c/Csd1 [Planctomycetota bacterium]